MSLRQLVYVSRYSQELSGNEMEALLKQVRAKNERLGVTGMLLAGDGRFLQVLEGPEEVVRALYETIRKDPRHTKCYVVAERTIETREFSDWSMGFATMRANDLRSEPGFVDFFAEQFPVDAFATGELARNVILAFRKRLPR